MDAAGTAAAGDRLRDLLRASTSVVEHLELDEVLTAIVDAARSLTGAQYGALGVLGPDGLLERFIHRGIPADAARAIGDPPHGRGVLGAVIAAEHPIRLPHVSDDPRSVGFPPHHPPMHPFLGVPIRVRDAVYGDLYLADAQGEFTADDEDLVVALAATAGIAIENARLYERTRTREAWTTALADVLGALLDATGDDALDVVVERVAPVLGARLVTLAVPVRGGTHLVVTAAHGQAADTVRGRVSSATGTLAGRALSSRRAARVEALPAASLSDAPQGPTVALPLFAGDEALGVLTISRAPGAPTFGDIDLEMAFVFAGEAGLAIEVARGRDDRRRLEFARSRAHIARDLHDHVIQRLYGAGLALQAFAAEAPATGLDEQIDALDDTIREIRTVILALGAEGAPSADGARERLVTALAEASGDVGLHPTIRFAGAIDTLVSREVADDVAALLRRAVADAAATAAPTLDVSLTAAAGSVTLEVHLPGIGDGLAAVAGERAAARGGSAAVAGTTLTWTVPLVEGGTA
ncbi:GAF domain-containing protein [Microbacterium fluvii]|uniref:GAF domain-containing protein n=1 Tax=Microbacterium fluvii TaxID=415215 RepID=A0ABW2HB96_9MICO|nr:GAF domain-containing protein [Microbacterium fluvii]MCU4670971.1 GAF domain-containing protein [Microbacterium fluvii]